MILLYIYLGISVLCLIMYTLATIDMTHKFRTRYPDLKPKRTSLAGKLFVAIKMVVVSFIPLMNIGLLWVVLFNYDDLETRTLAKVYLDCVKEET